MADPEERDEYPHMIEVDRADEAHRPTEHDEARVLADLYGEPDEAGIYQGEGA